MDGNRLIFSNRKYEDQPLNGIDLIFKLFIGHVLIYNHELCEETLINSLKKALQVNPYFSGRLRYLDTNRPVVTACDSGVLFSVETYKEKISDFYSPDGLHMKGSLIKPTGNDIDENTPLLQIKLSKYSNGSVLGVSFYHALCDGQSIFDFLNIWGRLARGQKIELPVFNRQFSCEFKSNAKIHPDDSITPLRYKENKLGSSSTYSSRKTFRITSEFLETLLLNAKKQGIKWNIGIEESLLMSHIWKLIVLNQNVEYNNAVFSQYYNFRPLLGLSKYCFCNASIPPYIEIDRARFVDMSIGEISKEILAQRDSLFTHPDQVRKSISQWDDQIKSDVNQTYLYKVGDLILNGGGLLINNTSKLPIYEVDFGLGQPVWYDMPMTNPIGRYVFLYPDPEKNSDIVMIVVLPETELSCFSEQFHRVEGG